MGDRIRGLSAEPLVGLKPSMSAISSAPTALSAEPLVGLKHAGPLRLSDHQILSAEPLVGLKLIILSAVGSGAGAFSRTPRGFEACGRTDISANSEAFSRTPRGFEASRTTFLERF